MAHQVAEAVRQGAKSLVDPGHFAADKPGTPYMAPQVLVDVTHGMRVMTEESFGPVIGIMKVKSDDEAVALMNDSAYGLTAALWTADVAAAEKLGQRAFRWQPGTGRKFAARDQARYLIGDLPVEPAGFDRLQRQAARPP